MKTILQKLMLRNQYKTREYRLRILWRYSKLLCISSLIALLVFDSEAMHSLLKQQEAPSYLEESNDKTRAKENNEKEEQEEIIYAVKNQWKSHMKIVQKQKMTWDIYIVHI